MIRKLFLWIQIRSLEIMMDSRDSIRPYVRDNVSLANMDLIQSITQTEVRRLKREYSNV
jgi:hypothetical protein